VSTVKEIATLIAKCQTVYGAGNGGSAATVSHFLADLQKSTGINTVSLMQVEKVTALSNDVGPWAMFYQQLIHLRSLKEGFDVIFVASYSGKSDNIVKLVNYATGNMHGDKPKRLFVTIALTGIPGGQVARNSNYCIKVKGNIRQVENEHLRICHDIITAVENV
jgi:D-sedoheptulose 7-phosphate isomerase